MMSSNQTVEDMAQARGISRVDVSKLQVFPWGMSRE